jgi:hypothetical protein
LINNLKKNNLCDIQYIGREPNKDSILICSSLFKLNDMYKDISVYINGLIKLTNHIIKQKYHLLLFYDHSVIQDEKFILYMNSNIENNSPVLFCKYNCVSFIKNNLHRGLFGTFVRFYPLFIDKYKNNIIYIRDIDVDNNNELIMMDYFLNLFKKNINNFVVQCRIGYEYVYANQYTNDYINGVALANCFIKNIVLPIEILEDYLIKLRDNDSIILKTIKNMQLKLKKLKPDLNVGYFKGKFGNIDSFSYGIDELWINKILLNYIFKKYKQVGIIYRIDILQTYIKMIDVEKSNKLILNQFLQKYLKNKFIKKNIHANLKYIFSVKLNFIKIKSISDYF